MRVPYRIINETDVVNVIDRRIRVLRSEIAAMTSRSPKIVGLTAQIQVLEALKGDLASIVPYVGADAVRAGKAG